MLDWLLRVVSVGAAFWLLHLYVVSNSGESLSPASIESLRHSLLEVWRGADEVVGRFEAIIFSPLTIGLIVVAVLACSLVRPAGR